MSDVKRCEELERKLRYIESECVKTDIVAAGCGHDEVDAPAPREVAEIESNISEVETNIRESGDNLGSLMSVFDDSKLLFILIISRRNKHELIEIMNVLTKSEEFWNMNLELATENGIGKSIGNQNELGEPSNRKKNKV